jgi:peptidylprolyl isomerase
MKRRQVICALLLCGSVLIFGAEPAKPKGRTVAEVLAASQPGDWRPLAPESTLYMEVPGGRVIIELAPVFAPR